MFHPGAKTPLVSDAEDEMLQVSLAAAFMKNAEILQPWNTIGAHQWIQAGRWWLMKVGVESELYRLAEANLENRPKWSCMRSLIRKRPFLSNVMSIS
jgi:hypothetical protein